MQAEIGKAFKEVEAAENKSVSIENRIRWIPGVSNNLLPKNKIWWKSWIILASMIEANDQDLGAYLGLSRNKYLDAANSLESLVKLEKRMRKVQVNNQ